MLKKRLAAAVIALAVLLLFSGCDAITSDTEELLRPPELTGEMNPVRQALKSSVKSEITLKYPSSGSYRSAIIMRDADGDGRQEAFAFYSTNDRQLTTMNVSLIRYDSGDKSWRVTDSQSITASGVDKVDFCDLDGDGNEEILVGWQIYGESEKQLSAYSLTAKSLTQRMLEQYTAFTCCDLDEDGSGEVLLQYLDSAASENTASLIRLDENGILRYGSCRMDGNVKTVKPPVLSTLSNGKPAVYFDEIKGIGAVTEILFMSKGELVNPLLDAESGENKATLRESALMSVDINGDGILEIPIAVSVANADITSSEKLFCTAWSSYNGEKFTSMKLSYVNTADNYRLDIPEKWIDAVAVSKDTESRSRSLYIYNKATGEVGERIATFRALTTADFSAGRGFNKKTAEELFRNDAFVYIGFAGDKITSADGNDEFELDKQDLKRMFVPVQFQ